MGGVFDVCLHMDGRLDRGRQIKWKGTRVCRLSQVGFKVERSRKLEAVLRSGLCTYFLVYSV